MGKKKEKKVVKKEVKKKNIRSPMSTKTSMGIRLKHLNEMIPKQVSNAVVVKGKLGKLDKQIKGVEETVDRLKKEYRRVNGLHCELLTKITSWRREKSVIEEALKKL